MAVVVAVLVLDQTFVQEMVPGSGGDGDDDADVFLIVGDVSVDSNTEWAQ